MFKLTGAARLSPPPHVAVTGASSGLGAALAEWHARQGARLSLFGRDRVRLGQCADRCKALGAEVAPYSCDVLDAAEMTRRLIEADDLAPVTHLIANAGIGGSVALAPACGESGDAARLLIATNMTGLVNTLTPLLPRMVERRDGRIGIISSLAGYSGLPRSPAYSASKAAARVYGEGLRRLLEPSGVSVTVVCPGFIDTPMSASLPMRRPFLVSSDKAAAQIADAMARRKAEISFPWQLALTMQLGLWLPRPVADRLLAASARWSARP